MLTLIPEGAHLACHIKVRSNGTPGGGDSRITGKLIRPPWPLRHPTLVRAVAIELAPQPRYTMINAERLWNVYEG